MKTLADVLLADFNVYRAQTKFFHDLIKRGAYVSVYKMTDARRELFDELVAWCRERHIEPRLWVFFLYKRRAWRGAPALKDTNLMSEGLVASYRRGVNALGFFVVRMRISRLDEESDATFDPNRDTTHSVEALKRALVMEGKTEQCMDEIPIRTLGYHPKSPVCVVCPAQARCYLRLQGYLRFDVLALRLGHITSTQAEQQARL